MLTFKTPADFYDARTTCRAACLLKLIRLNTSPNQLNRASCFYFQSLFPNINRNSILDYQKLDSPAVTFE